MPPENEDAIKRKRREYYQKNKERILADGKAYRRANPDKAKAWKKAWRERNPEKFRAMMAASKKRGRCTPAGRINRRIRERLRQYFQSGTSLARIEQRLGYTMEQLAVHLERQFLPGMSWENRAEWHIDHIVPLSSFKYETPDCPEFRAAWALTNLRPMWARANESKGSKRTFLL